MDTVANEIAFLKAMIVRLERLIGELYKLVEDQAREIKQIKAEQRRQS